MSAKARDSQVVTTARVAAAAVLWALLAAIAPLKASAAELEPLQKVSGSFFDLEVATLNSSLALDAGRSEHMAIDRWAPGFGAQRVTYAYCAAADCVTPDAWPQVHLRDVPEITGPSQLRLTPDGKPRILLTAGDADNRTTFLYAACDSGCTTLAGWTVLDLGSVFNKPSDIWGVSDDHSFDLDPQGRPRFVYSFQDEVGAGFFHYAACDTGCTTSVANWTKTSVSQPTGAVPERLSFLYSSLSLDFTAAGQPRVAGYIWELPSFGGGETNIAYLECDSACSAPEPVPPASPNWRVGVVAEQRGQEVVMRLDNNDVPHMIVGGLGDLVSPFSRMRCAGACTTATNWSTAPLPFTGADAALVFGADNRPQVAFNNDAGGPALDYARCNAACDTAGATWQVEEIQNNEPFRQAMPRPGGCGGPGAWLVAYNPSLALDTVGNPRVSFVGQHVIPNCSGDLRVDAVAVRLDRFRLSAPVTPRRAIGDYDGDGDTDRGVYRRGAWFTEGQPTAFLGTATDVPVPGDYDGDGDTDRAVYRDGTWFTDGQPTASLGLAGDIPVPGDYDGDGDTDRAVFRPGVGGWYVEGQAAVFFGQSSDIPVPGDYDGDGDTERAVFRPAVGGWYVEGLPTAFLGLDGDIPVPGDYNGDGDSERAVFRPAVGGWYVEGLAAVFLGLNGDIPVPGDYNGDGDTERAIFRPAVGGWYTEGLPAVFLGLQGDIPLPLPQAVYRRFFTS